MEIGIIFDFSYSEKAALRLAAAKALLKLLQEKLFVGLLTMPQFRVIAKVIVVSKFLVVGFVCWTRVGGVGY